MAKKKKAEAEAKERELAEQAKAEKFLVLHHGVGAYGHGEVVEAANFTDQIPRLLKLGAIEPYVEPEEDEEDEEELEGEDEPEDEEGKKDPAAVKATPDAQVQPVPVQPVAPLHGQDRGKAKASDPATASEREVRKATGEDASTVNPGRTRPGSPGHGRTE